RLLPAAATGQGVITYLSLFTGPGTAAKSDPPRELHLILVDNGRSRILADSSHREVLDCIRCGACLNVCPAYREIGGKGYGSVYSGPIGAVLTPLLWPGERTSLLPWISTLCGACVDSCPVKIPLPSLLVRLRRREVEAGRTPRAERIGFSLSGLVMARPRLYRIASRLLRLFLRLGGDSLLRGMGPAARLLRVGSADRSRRPSREGATLEKR
ncbi:partial glycolate oxidase iron-sulfur subunit, partial [Methylacidimicrobium cyclopophantes]